MHLDTVLFSIPIRQFCLRPRVATVREVRRSQAKFAKRIQNFDLCASLTSTWLIKKLFCKYPPFFYNFHRQNSQHRRLSLISIQASLYRSRYSTSFLIRLFEKRKFISEERRNEKTLGYSKNSRIRSNKQIQARNPELDTNVDTRCSPLQWMVSKWTWTVVSFELLAERQDENSFL